MPIPSRHLPCSSSDEDHEFLSPSTPVFSPIHPLENLEPNGQHSHPHEEVDIYGPSLSQSPERRRKSPQDLYHDLETKLEETWKVYVEFAQRNRSKLLLVDGISERFLWWILPLKQQSQQQLQQSQQLSQTSPPWTRQYFRSIAWSILHLHRLALDLALQQETYHEHGSSACHFVGDDGTTLQLPSTAENDKRTFRLQLGLSILQSLWPLCTDLFLGDATNGALSRKWLERVRLLLRGALLARHVLRFQQMNGRNNSTSVLPGLLKMGGLLFPPNGTSFPGTPTLAEQQARQVREQYVGRRTGRRVLSATRDSKENDTAPSNQKNVRVLLGELLHILRPAFWAEAEAHCRQKLNGNQTLSLWNAWLVSLGMDLASLGLLQSATQPPHATTNPCTNQELMRRRMRFLLYMLRSPMWQNVSQPCVERSCQIMERYLPILGHFISLYFQDWIFFWKDYRLEEG